MNQQKFFTIEHKEYESLLGRRNTVSNEKWLTFSQWFLQRIIMLLAALVMVLLMLPTVSHTITIKQKALVGLKGVRVDVEDMDAQVERLGLTKDQIKTDVELKLRKAGIRVLTDNEVFATPGMPSLYVNINTLISPELPFIVCSISAELIEVVKLARGFEVTGTIWDIGSVGRVGTGNIRKLREYLGDIVDKFINDYLAANPK